MLYANYVAEVRRDAKKYIRDNWDALKDLTDSQFIHTLAEADEVTGYVSQSYAFSHNYAFGRTTALENVREALADPAMIYIVKCNYCAEQLVNCLSNADYEGVDVLFRQLIVSDAIAPVLHCYRAQVEMERN